MQHIYILNTVHGKEMDGALASRGYHHKRNLAAVMDRIWVI